ncbi:SDR family NAD(P)-dependent oxidoreductase [Acetobacter oeni]|uniref:3-oxoacyl-ACP reductase n=1 Tax=Acetobacter oeni TaxID=304077 RepID=A0A511XHJ6_9PROT|nr:SDR family NAD(P)-dependent oxidoreductase [Acetobacter oeni]MBB3881265.1 3-oxoacyl-[acyl-carrier protein] reductase [Acetobacter oeni]NHO18140.1 SDR family NAD(P)-dependent oxidoreductase [Acetobacter oeni]GBR08163.1 dehydrogenase [Acetobacter oeni LMG 21952]GEN62420.1 3-oxoacyl-ACP reductase [Acetobacter oeni]
MDLGIADRRAIVCAASKGLGYAVAEHLAAAGVHLTINARNAEVLQDAADRLTICYGVEVKVVAADITTREGRQAVLEAEPAPDILINNAGGPPSGVWSDWDEADWLAAINGNMLTPIMMMKSVLPGMIGRKWGRVVNITSAAVKNPIPDLGLSNAARCGLTGFVAGTARQAASDGVIINNLLPGMHKTDRLKGRIGKDADRLGISVEEAERELAKSVPAGHIGRPGDFGATAAFLCSEHAGFMVAQNVLLDGGAFNSTM